MQIGHRQVTGFVKDNFVHNLSCQLMPLCHFFGFPWKVQSRAFYGVVHQVSVIYAVSLGEKLVSGKRLQLQVGSIFAHGIGPVNLAISSHRHSGHEIRKCRLISRPLQMHCAWRLRAAPSGASESAMISQICWNDLNTLKKSLNFGNSQPSRNTRLGIGISNGIATVVPLVTWVVNQVCGIQIRFLSRE